MPKLTTKSHRCATIIVAGDGTPLGHCSYPAFRKHDGRWLCRPCTHRAKGTASTKREPTGQRCEVCHRPIETNAKIDDDMAKTGRTVCVGCGPLTRAFPV
jgi:hypothetical protein